MDDGAHDVAESMQLLLESSRQGVNAVFATAHFYADTEDPDTFLSRRDKSYSALRNAIALSAAPELFPDIHLGAEVLYFPGMSCSEDLSRLIIDDTYCLLVEPPAVRWTDIMLEEIEQTGKNLNCIPVIAHIDRYMRIFSDYSLIERVQGRRMLIQANASFLLHPDTTVLALQLISEGKIHLLGSDCHNLSTRPPNIGRAAEAARSLGFADAFSKLDYNAFFLLHQRA